MRRTWVGTQLTRRELVLQLLQQHTNEWVDGTRIASAEVGGSEGLKRLRELRQEGHDIRMRRHPDPRRDIYQYRLVTEPGAGGARESYRNETLPRGPVAAPPVPAIPPAQTPGMLGRDFPLRKNDDGSIEIVWQLCPDCGGRYAVEADHIPGEEHQRWLRLSQTVEGATPIPETPQPPVYAYTERPEGVTFGEAAVCPRCRGVRRKAGIRGSKFHPADTMCMDPKDHSIYCRRCNGWGIVPNMGPVTMTKAPPPEPEEPAEEAPTTEAFTDG